VTELQQGDLLAHYRLEGKLGEGGMGEVYRARDTKLDRTVAIKLLPFSATQDPEARHRLLQEARSAASLSHPNIVTIYSVDEAEGRAFIVMEYVQGATLDALAREGGIDYPAWVEIGVQVADALAAAHALGLVHRDIKPANILVTTPGIAKVLDFGLAKSTTLPSGPAGDATVAQFTAPGLIMGTIAYMSPEQARGEPLDARSDIFALGSTLYEALTGRRAFRGESALETMHAIATATPPAPSVIQPELPSDVDLILARAMAKDREERYGSSRDFADALRALRIAADHVTSTITLPRQLAARGPSNLPSQLTSFIGRRRERAEVRRLFGSSRVVTLTGPGGSGKTRLGIQVATDMLTEQPDGAWLVELESLDDPALVPQSLARVLDITEEPGRPLLETLAATIAEREILVLLDNCEHLASAVASTAETLLRGCPSLKILATSREPLGLRGELVWRVPTLSVPDPRTSAVKTKEAVARFESVRLFVDRAVAVHPSFQLTDKNAPTIAQICHRLDGIPLAIELAAVRVKVLAVEKILDRLSDRFQLLTGGTRTALPRHQTLRATMDWSYELLSGKERALLQRASVFAGGFTLESAEGICPEGEIKDADVLDLLSALVDKSLVVSEETENGGRYRLLETIRDYGAEKLREGGDSEMLAVRHANFFVILAEAAESELRGPEQGHWLTLLEEDHDNLRLAMRTCLGRRDAAGALQMAGALWRFWYVRGYWEEGRKRIGEALAMLESLPPTIERAKALYGGGVLTRVRGDFPTAEALIRESLKIAIALDARGAVADALYEMGNIANQREDLVQARTFYEQALALRRELEDRPGIALTSHGLAVVAYAMGDPAAARTLYEEAIAIQRERGNLRSEAAGLNGLGDVALYQGDLAKAREYQNRSLAIQRQLGDKSGIAFSLRLLGRVAVRDGDIPSARQLLIESLEIFKEVGDTGGVVDVIEAMAELWAAGGNSERALRLAGAAIAHREVIGVPLAGPDAEQLQRSLETARNQAGESADRILREGRALTLDQAVAEAIRSE
jgi:non-specific serine/threonine protein kinase